MPDVHVTSRPWRAFRLRPAAFSKRWGRPSSAAFICDAAKHLMRSNMGKNDSTARNMRLWQPFTAAHREKLTTTPPLSPRSRSRTPPPDLRSSPGFQRASASAPSESCCAVLPSASRHPGGRRGQTAVRCKNVSNEHTTVGRQRNNSGLPFLECKPGQVLAVELLEFFWFVLQTANDGLDLVLGQQRHGARSPAELE